MHLVKIACERPDDLGPLAVAAGTAARWPGNWSPTAWWRASRRRPSGGSCEHHHLKPWRQHLWLSPKVPRDAAFAAGVQEICDLYTRPLGADEVVLCVDEKTSLQPRPRKSPTLAADSRTDRSGSSTSTGGAGR